MVNKKPPLGVKTQNKKVAKKKPRPQWDGSINDVSSMKLSKSEQEKRTKLYSARHMEKLRNEIRDVKRQEQRIEKEIYSSPFTAHNQSVVFHDTTSNTSKLQALLNETDRKMAEARDMFGDNCYKYRVIPNVTSAPRYKHSPVTLVKCVDESPSPPRALNDTTKLGMLTVERLPPPDTATLDLTRIKLLLEQEKENHVTQYHVTQPHVTQQSTTAAAKVKQTLNFDEDNTLSLLKMDRSPRSRKRQTVRISDSKEEYSDEDRTLWSPVPVPQADDVVVSSKPDKAEFQGSFDQSPPRLRESSSESNISPSRLKKQRSLEIEEKRRSLEKEEKKKILENEKKKARSPPQQTVTSPVRLSNNLPNASSEHQYPVPILKIPARRESLNREMGDGLELDPIRGSRSPSGRSPQHSPRSSRHQLVSTATSPFGPLSPDSKKTRSSATSPRPVTGARPTTTNTATSPVRAHIRGEEKRSVKTPLMIERGTTDRPYTDEELKDRLEHLIVGGHYPFAKITQRSYAITEQDGQQSDKPEAVWVKAGNTTAVPDNMTFVDSSPLKDAALQLEIKLRRYQAQIGASPAKKPAVSGFTGYTALLLQSVSTMIGYLGDQEGSSLNERSMREEVIDTMGALQNTVETLSTELLSCRRDLSDTRQQVRTLEHEFSTTVAFLVDNCVLKDPSLQTPIVPHRVKELPTVVSPFNTTVPNEQKASTDLLLFTPHPHKTDNLMEFTPALPQTNKTTDSTLIQLTPETSEDYLKFLEQKTNALRNDLDSKINKISTSALSAEKIDDKISRISKEYRPDLSTGEQDTSSRPDSTLNISTYTDDSLDLSQDLDALIDRLKLMNAQTLAVTSEQLGITPRKGLTEDSTEDSFKNIKVSLATVGSEPSEAATAVIESYNSKSDFSPSQLLPAQEFLDNAPKYPEELLSSLGPSSRKKHNTSRSPRHYPQNSTLNSTPAGKQNSLSTEVSPIIISPPDVVRAANSAGDLLLPRQIRISGEFIGSYSAFDESLTAKRPKSPNPLSPRRLTEEIKRSTVADSKREIVTQERLNVSTPERLNVSTPERSNISTPGRLDVSTPGSKSGLSRSSSSIFQSPPSAFSPPTKDDSPRPDTGDLINQFLSQNPHYLKKISASLSSASLPAMLAQGGESPPRESCTSPPRSEHSPPRGKPPVEKGAVNKRIAKFEQHHQEVEAQLQRQRSLSPKRRSSKRGRGNLSLSSLSPERQVSPERQMLSKRQMSPERRMFPERKVSPERKASPERKMKHRVSWEEDPIKEFPSNMRPNKLDVNGETTEQKQPAPKHKGSQQPVQKQLPTKKSTQKPSTAKQAVTKPPIQKQTLPKQLAQKQPVQKQAATKPPVEQREEPTDDKALPVDGIVIPTAETNDKSLMDYSKSNDSGSDLMAQLMSLNDAKLTELVTTLNKLTER